MEHNFSGRHFIGNYFGCDHDSLIDHDSLLQAMKEAVIASGAGLLKSVNHDFLPSGFSALLLLSESHASIHTYPEYNACFVDLFTCGQSCIAENFHAVLADYLLPADFQQRVLLRDHCIKDDILKVLPQD